MSTARSCWVATPEGRLHVGVLGPPGAAPLLLLHDGGGGFGDSAWPAVLSELAMGRQGPGRECWRILRVDRLGYGLSDPRPGGFPPGFFTMDLTHLDLVLNALVPEHEFALSGSSDGGTLALLAAARWPERVRGVAVDGAHYRTERSMMPVLLDMRARFIERHGPGSSNEDHRLVTLRRWFDGWLAICATGWSIENELAAVHCPVQVLQGELDGIVEDRHAHELAALLGRPGVAWILPGGAHLCQRSHPEVWADWLMDFLAGLPRHPARRS